MLVNLGRFWANRSGQTRAIAVWLQRIAGGPCAAFGLCILLCKPAGFSKKHKPDSAPGGGADLSGFGIGHQPGDWTANRHWDWRGGRGVFREPTWNKKRRRYFSRNV